MREFKVGELASFTKTITEADVVLFAGLSGDLNPIHVNDLYAVRTRFKGRIAHGALVASLISNVIGNQLPGPGAIYLGSSLRFHAPTYIGDTITATAELKAVRPDKPILTLQTRCYNQRGETVISGEATILYEPVEEVRA